jgi:hypothetical protein
MWVVAGGMIAGASRPMATHNGTCTGSWTALSGSRRPEPPIFADELQLADWRGGIVAVGDPAFEMLADSIAEGRLMGAAAWDASGKRSVLLTPIGARPAMYPRAASTSDGVLHVVYGTVNDFAHRTAFTRPDTLWHIEFSARGWSTPTSFPAIAPGSVWWEHLSSSSMLTNGTTLDIALSMRRRGTAVVLLHRDADGQWHQFPIETGGPLVLNARLARVGRTLVLSYRAPDPNIVGSDGGSVFAMRSSDDGRSWTRPTRVFLAGGRDTYDHALLADSTGALYLLWRQQNAQPPKFSDTIAVSTSVDTGATWHALPPLVVSDGSTGLAAAWSPQGVFVVFKSIRSGTQAALLRGQEWTPVRMQPALAGISGIALHPLRDGSLALVGTGSVHDQTAATHRTVPPTEAYRLTIACDR